MLQIAWFDCFLLYHSEGWGENSNKILPFYWNKPLLFFRHAVLWLLPERCAQIFSFHDVDRIDMRTLVMSCSIIGPSSNSSVT
jgi:hypothetical protein